MPIEGSAGTLDIENATLRSNAIAVLANLVTGNDRVRESGAPALEVYGDPSNGGNEARLEMVSNTATVSSSAFTRLTSNAGVLSVKTGTDASDNGTITFGGFANERMRIGSDGNVGIGTTSPATPFHINKLTATTNPKAHTTTEFIRIRGDKVIGQTYAISGGIKLGGETGGTATADGRMEFYVNDGAGVSNDYGDIPDKLVMCMRGDGHVGIGTTNPAEKLDVQGSALITGTTYGIKSTGTLGSDKSEGWYRLLIGGIRDGTSAIRTKCKLHLLASGLHQTLTFDFNHMINLSQTSGNSFNLLGNDHYISRVGITKLRLADAGSNQFALDMYIDHDVVPVERDWTITLYTEGGSLISEATTFLEKITATPSASIELDTDTSIFGIVGSTTSKTLIMHENGNVGIGVTNPFCRLEIYGSANGTASGSNDRAFFQFSNGTALSNDTGSGSGVSVWSHDWVGSGAGFIAANATTFSDERLKKNIVDADDGECLDILRQLQPKKYNYVDVVQRGETPVWGFIAQEVEAILPYSTHNFQEYIPNIYELANVSSSNVITFTNFNTSNLEANATIIRVKTVNGGQENVTLTEVIDEHTIRVEEDLNEWTGSIDETGNVVTGNQLFIFGQRMEDVRGLKKDAIWTVATSALQEIDRQLQAEKAKVATLETQVADLLARV